MSLKLEFTSSSITFLLILMQQNKLYDYSHLKITKMGGMRLHMNLMCLL